MFLFFTFNKAIFSTRKKRTGFLILFSLLFLISCEDSYGIDSAFSQDTTLFINQRQFEFLSIEYGALFKEFEQRNQISDLQVSASSCDIRFNDGMIFHFPQNIFPIIQPDNNGYWTISGLSTETDVKTGANGELLYPSLSIGEDGYWSLDNLHTNFSARYYHALLQKAGNDTLNVVGLLPHEDNLFIYLSNNSVYKYTVIKEAFYLVPDYWMKNLVEKEELAEAAIKEAEGNSATFVFFTDTHWGKNMRKSPSLIRHIIDFTPIDDVIFGGDVITTHYGNIVDPIILGLDFQASFAFLGTRFHCLYGNHDNNSDSQPGKTDFHLSEEQVFAWLQSQMTDVVYGGYYNFYYDNPLTQTRIICLDTGRYYYSKFRDNLPKTVSFAINALSTLPDGWHAIMASHIWCNLKKQSDGTYKHYLESYIKSILKVFDDYNSKLSGIYRYGNSSISYDFSQAGGRIEFCIGGHTHQNYTTASEGGIPIIIVISDRLNDHEEGTTTNEQSVTLVVTDYKNRKLHLFVVGRGIDRCIDL